VPLSPTPGIFTLSGPVWTGLATFRSPSIRPGASFSAAATSDGAPVTASCLAQAGLPALTARAQRTLTGAEVTWAPVAGAAEYRWSLLDGPTGAVVASGRSDTATTATAIAALDPAKVHLFEVEAAMVKAAATTFPSPLPVPRASFARVPLTGGNLGGDASAWQLFGPNDYVNGQLTVSYPALAAGERLAVLLVNAGGDDNGLSTVSAVGTGSPTLAMAPLATRAAAGGAPPGVGAPDELADVMAGEALVSARREEIIARLRDGRLRRLPPLGPTAARIAAAASVPPDRYFCQGQVTTTGAWTQVWKHATLASETPRAAFYYTDEVQPGITAALARRSDFFTRLGASYEGSAGPPVTRGIVDNLNLYFGPETDVDGNGKVIFLFADLGKDATSGFVAGYFEPGDLVYPLATADSCSSGRTGNQADMLYLLDPGNFTANWAGKGPYDYVLGLVAGGYYQSIMAHELQHDVNLNSHCPPVGSCGPSEELWLNEGLSMLSETVAGYGLHTATGRSNVRRYLGASTTTGLPFYQGFGMTIWPPAAGDPIGNYAAAQAYMQYLLDHASPAMTKALESPLLQGKANVEAATGVPWEVGFARFVTAAMFSNEDRSEPNGAAGSITSAGNALASPAYNFLGDGVAPDFVPWHRYPVSCAGTTVPIVTNVAFTPLASNANVTLRQDGWAAFATGPGPGGGAATIKVGSSATVRPHVAVVKYSGALPNYVAPVCP
jgi:hypothetical protein